MAKLTPPSAQDRLKTLFAKKDSTNILNNLRQSGAVTSQAEKYAAQDRTDQLAKKPMPSSQSYNQTVRRGIQPNVWERGEDGSLQFTAGGPNPMEELQKSALAGGRVEGLSGSFVPNPGMQRGENGLLLGSYAPVPTAPKSYVDPLTGRTIKTELGGVEKRDRYLGAGLHPEAMGPSNLEFDYDPRSLGVQAGPAQPGQNIPKAFNLVGAVDGKVIEGTDHYAFDQETRFDYMNDSSRAYETEGFRSQMIWDNFENYMDQNGVELPQFMLKSDAFGRPIGVEMAGEGSGFPHVDSALYNMHNELVKTQDPAEQAKIKRKYQSILASAAAQSLGLDSDIVRSADEAAKQERERLDRQAANEVSSYGNKYGEINSTQDLRNAQFQRSQDQLDQKLKLLEDQHNTQMQQYEAKRAQALKDNETKINKQLERQLASLESNNQLVTNAEGDLTAASSALESQVRANYLNMLQDANMQTNAYFDDRTSSLSSTYMDKQLEAYNSYDATLERYYSTIAEQEIKQEELDDGGMSNIEEFYWQEAIKNHFKDGDEVESPSITDFVKQMDTIMKWSPEQILANPDVISSVYTTYTGEEPDEEYVDNLYLASKTSELLKLAAQQKKTEAKSPFSTNGFAYLRYVMDLPSSSPQKKEYLNWLSKSPTTAVSNINSMGEILAGQEMLPNYYIEVAEDVLADDTGDSFIQTGINNMMEMATGEKSKNMIYNDKTGNLEINAESEDAADEELFNNL